MSAALLLSVSPISAVPAVAAARVAVDGGPLGASGVTVNLGTGGSIVASLPFADALTAALGLAAAPIAGPLGASALTANLGTGGSIEASLPFADASTTTVDIAATRVVVAPVGPAAALGVASLGTVPAAEAPGRVTATSPAALGKTGSEAAPRPMRLETASTAGPTVAPTLSVASSDGTNGVVATDIEAVLPILPEMLSAEFEAQPSSVALQAWTAQPGMVVAEMSTATPPSAAASPPAPPQAGLSPGTVGSDGPAPAEAALAPDRPASPQPTPAVPGALPEQPAPGSAPITTRIGASPPSHAGLTVATPPSVGPRASPASSYIAAVAPAAINAASVPSSLASPSAFRLETVAASAAPQILSPAPSDRAMPVPAPAAPVTASLAGLSAATSVRAVRPTASRIDLSAQAPVQPQPAPIAADEAALAGSVAPTRPAPAVASAVVPSPTAPWLAVAPPAVTPHALAAPTVTPPVAPSPTVAPPAGVALGDGVFGTLSTAEPRTQPSTAVALPIAPGPVVPSEPSAKGASPATVNGSTLAPAAPSAGPASPAATPPSVAERTDLNLQVAAPALDASPEVTSLDVAPAAPAEPAPPVEAAPAAAPAPRANPDTVTALAAELARKLDARITRFEVRLDPAGLGQVQVNVEIRAGGEVSAQLHFERPETAAELRGRSAELRTALEQAGFSVGGAALSFDSPGGRQSAPEPPARPLRRPLFAEAADVAASSPPPLRASRAGIDVRI